MEVSFASWPGSMSKANEDFVAASPKVAVVLDGLSAPPPLGTGCLHGTPWFVAQLGAQVMSAATTAGEEPLQDLVAGAITRVAESHAHSCDLDHPGTPSSSLAVLREQDRRVEYLLLFDSVIVLDGPSGLVVVTDRRVDAFARQEDLATREHPVGSPAHQERVQELVAAQRRHRNQPSGYWSLAPSRRPPIRRSPALGRSTRSIARPCSATASPAWSSGTPRSTGRSCWAFCRSTDPQAPYCVSVRLRRPIRSALAGPGTSAATTRRPPSAYSAEVTR